MKQSVVQRKKISDLPECEEIKANYEIVLFENGKVEVINTNTGKPLKGIKDKHGFLRYKLQRKTGYTAVRKSLNRLTALAFVSGYKPGLVASYKDKNSDNNEVSNLEWVRQKDIPRTSQKEQRIIKRVQINEMPECEGIQDYYCLDLRADGSTALFSKKHHKYLKAINSRGYLRYNLMKKDGTSVSKSLHRLTGLAFIEGYEPHLVINHIDHNKKNANVSNLEWITQKENLIHAIMTKPRQPQKNSPLQVSSSKTFSPPQQVEYIFQRYSAGAKQKEIAQELGVTQASVSLILNKKRWNEYSISKDSFKSAMAN